ncbi:transketolase [Candidatus Uhrbacteria bacterium CG10_big_fil_rev_8_21_14_0_10_48_16]|uniref:Transketolase n=1 Tax=Candidatus Uhrbacteria bacterium CG10_big_fil_rev_8_21_14_0_10_48_16 TaxID=1975038 RepID=A0A2M8LHN6_9BACT|nr:MAG: transketolase [Candidatus Uhrbacteria bacterium CG10_big_fil_rev_8_21_14_0_10_48_16]
MAKITKKTGINREAWLVRHLFDEKKLKQIPTRNGYGDGLVEAGKKNKNVVVLCCDLTESTRSDEFKKAFPDRFIQLGVTEQAMASMAAGLSLVGKVPFISSYAAFSPGRNWEQVKTNIAIQRSNVKIAGAHAGLSVGPDGATHQMLEDIAIMRAVPHMTVVAPCDYEETRKATLAGAVFKGPFYFRFARASSPAFTTAKTPFKIGRAELYRHGDDLTMIASGPLVYEALLAAERLSQDHGIEARVINCHTIKPLDEKMIVKCAKETGAIVTIEEAQVTGGLAGAVCETLALTVPVPVERIGAQDRFGESGEPREVQDGLGVTAPFIALAADRVLQRKLGNRVPPIPAHILSAQNDLALIQKEVLAESLARAPKKWGGTKPNNTLKSRKNS